MSAAFDDDVTLTVQIGFVSAPTVSLASTVWTDVSDDVRAFETDRGRQYELDRFEAGTATILLNNRHRNYDPTNTSSPHSPNVVPMRRVRIVATTHGNLLTVNQASLETDTTGWAASIGTTIARSTAQSLDGSASLSVTRTSTSGSASARTLAGASGVKVVGGDTYTAMAWLRAGSVARSFTFALQFYDGLGVFISGGIPSTSGTDTTTGWTKVSVTGAAPSNAAFAEVFVSFTSVAVGELHHVDQAGIFPGDVTEWSNTGTAATHNVFTGYVENWDQEYPTHTVNAGDAVVPLRCVDAFELLALNELPDSPWAAEIWEDYHDNNDGRPMAWYRLGDTDEGETRAIDAFGDTGKDGTYIGTTSTSGIVFKSSDGARSFDHSVPDYVKLPAPEQLIGAAYPFTIEAFIKIGDATTGSEPAPTVIFGGFVHPENTLSGPGVNFFVNTSGKLIAGADDGTNSRIVLSDRSDLDNREIHHVAARFASATDFSVWVDGFNHTDVPATVTTGTGQPSIIRIVGLAREWVIGSSFVWATPLDPYIIDDVVVWGGTSLTDAAIGAHASGGYDTAGGQRPNAAWGNDSPRNRILRLLIIWIKAIPNSSNDHEFDEGNSTLGPTTLGGSALEYFQKIAESEYGGLYVRKDGQLRLRARHTLLTTASHTTSQATFGDGSGELRYRTIKAPYDLTRVRNDVTVKREDGATRRAFDQTSIDKYSRRGRSLTGLLHDSDTESQDYANWLVSHYKDPDLRIDAIEITPRRDPAGLWPQALGRELEDRVTAKRRPPGGGTISKEVLIQRITHSVDASERTWVTGFQLSAADTQDYWVLGTSELGTDTRLAF